MEGNERLRAGFPLNGARGQHAMRDDIRTRLPPLQQQARGSASTTRLPARGGRGPRMMNSSKSAAELGARRRAAAEASAAMRDHPQAPELPPLPPNGRSPGGSNRTSPTRKQPQNGSSYGSPGGNAEYDQISTALRTQYAAILQIAEAVHAKPPQQLPPMAPPPEDSRLKAENEQLHAVVERQNAEIARLRATLNQLQGVAAAAAAPASTYNAGAVSTSGGAGSPPRRNRGGSKAAAAAAHEPQPSPLPPLPPYDTQQQQVYSSPPPRSNRTLSPDVWVAVLGPLVRRKDEFCAKLAERLGGQIVRSGRPADELGQGATSRAQLDTLVEQMRRGRGPHVLSDYPRTQLQLADISKEVRAAAVDAPRTRLATCTRTLTCSRSRTPIRHGKPSPRLPSSVVRRPSSVVRRPHPSSRLTHPSVRAWGTRWARRSCCFRSSSPASRTASARR